MKKVSVVIPNYNGMKYLKICLDSLKTQTLQEFDIICVDNGSADESVEFIEKEYPYVKLIKLDTNTGFCHAVNVGIQNAKTDYVVLLNNDTQAEPEFLEELCKGMEGNPHIFSGCAKILQYHDRTKMDDAGDLYNAFGWAFARGKGKPETEFDKPAKIFSSCGAAVILRKQAALELGLFDEEHFAYLEDMDIGYRARIAGYENWYFPKARVYHVGSATSGSQYNLFKVRYSSRNNVYMIYKNMPLLQIIINVPFLLVGFGAKFVFFLKKGFGREYAAGIKNGFLLCKREKKVPFSWHNLPNYGKIQIDLWINLFKRFL